MAKQVKWQKGGSKESGYVYYKKHPTRKHGVKYDRYYRAEYQHKGKRIAINFGWASDGWSELICLEKLNYYKNNAKKGLKPVSLKEEREMAELKNAEEEKKKDIENKENVIFAVFWNDHYKPYSEQKKNWQAEKSFWENWIKDSIGKKRMKHITIFDLEKLKNKMDKAGKSPKTIQHVLATIRQVFNRAINIDMFPGPNPVSKIKLQKINNQRVRFLNNDEAAVLLETLKEKSNQVHDMALLSLHTGMRAKEIFSLSWQHIDFDNDMIHIVDTKNTESRYAYMSYTVKEMLQNNFQNRTTEFVFPGSNGNQIKYISKTFPRVVDGLGFNKAISDNRNKVVFHTLRHTFASWQAQNGMDLYTLQKLMGHKSFQMVQRYAHLAPDNLKKATRLFNKMTNQEKIIPFPKQA
jgi:integrase